jgi:hypothetical protein
VDGRKRVLPRQVGLGGQHAREQNGQAGGPAVLLTEDAWQCCSLGKGWRCCSLMTGLAAHYDALLLRGTSAHKTARDWLSDPGEVARGALQIEPQCEELHAPMTHGAFEHIDASGSDASANVAGECQDACVFDGVKARRGTLVASRHVLGPTRARHVKCESRVFEQAPTTMDAQARRL